jgi:hypothetical protein
LRQAHRLAQVLDVSTLREVPVELLRVVFEVHLQEGLDYAAVVEPHLLVDGAEHLLAQLLVVSVFVTRSVTQPDGDVLLRIVLPSCATGAMVFYVVIAACRKCQCTSKSTPRKGVYYELPVFNRGLTTGEAVRIGVKIVDFKSTNFANLEPTYVKLTCTKPRCAGLRRKLSPRVFTVIVTLASLLFNIVFIVYEFAIITPRSPDVPLDLARKLVIIGKFTNVSMMTVQLIASVVYAVYFDAVKGILFDVTSTIAAMNLFLASAFSLIMLASPEVAMRSWSNMKRSLDSASATKTKKFFFELGFLLLSALNAGLGLLAVAAKLSQFSFLSSLDFMDWSSDQWFSFLAMGNQLAGLASNPLRCALLYHTRINSLPNSMFSI